MIEEDLSRPNLREHVYEILKKKIILREIKPGEKINEELLAKTLNVSRTPIRETLFRLEHEGIVRTIPRRGAFVVSQSKEEIVELLYVREALEGLTARMATKNMDRATLEKLRECLHRISSEQEKNDKLLKYTPSDVEFHSLLLDACKNNLLKSMMGIVNSQLQMIRLRTVTLPGRAEQTVREHYEILEAIEKGDADLAERAMRKHVASVRKDAFKNIDLME
jgi:DNA-binding GntR family transcriptional regulator